MEYGTVPPPLPARRNENETEEEVERRIRGLRVDTSAPCANLFPSSASSTAARDYTAPALPKRKQVGGQQAISGVSQDRLCTETPRDQNVEAHSLLSEEEFVQSPESVISLGQTLSPTTSESKEKSVWKKGFEEARHVAGSLVAHPHESTKHFSVLRHSHGLVFYQGPKTSVAITVFSDKPLPADRTIWLQKKGWLGKAGWAARAVVGSNSSWVNVTPERYSSADAIAAGSPNDERAWQRDIKKFVKKAPKELRKHVPRETNIVRIPDTDLGDGYFRLVVCEGGGSKRALCPSPVFRVASVSTSSASFKGASLGNLPMEIGVSVATQLATSQANAVVAPVTNAVSNQVQQYAPGFWTQQVATTAYDASGVPDRIDSANEQYTRTRTGAFEQIENGQGVQRELSRGEEARGPTPPFPLRMKSKIVKGTGTSSADLGMPTANLKDMVQDVKYRLSGIYFGWARIETSTPSSESGKDQSPAAAAAPLPSAIQEKKRKKSLEADEEAEEDWKESIITVAPPSSHTTASSPIVAVENKCTVYLIHDFAGAEFFDSSISVLVMGYLRPCNRNSNNTNPNTSSSSSGSGSSINSPLSSIDQISQDITTALQTLSLPGWTIRNALEKSFSSSSGSGSNKNLTNRYVQARQLAQRQIDRVPLHRAGIRTETASLRDKVFERGGVCIPR